MLVENQIPHLESTLHQKQIECNQMSMLLHAKDDMITRKTMISKLKDEEMLKIRAENERLVLQEIELRKSLETANDLV